LNYNYNSIPFKYGISENFLPEDLSNEIGYYFPKWNDPIWDKYGSIFKNEYGHKKEMSNKSVMPHSIKSYFDYVESDKFVKMISDSTNIDNLFLDKNHYGGGLNIFPPGSELLPHTDFNYNDDLSAYRAVNIIYYVNPEWSNSDGGCFDGYSTDGKQLISVPPRLNTMLFFVSNNKTRHGVSKTLNKFYRKSINIWLYTKYPLDNVSEKPHKTKWLQRIV